MTMRPFMICLINGEMGSFVSKEEEKHESKAGKKIYRVFYHPIVGGNGGKWISKPEKLPYFVPEDAFIEDTIGKSNTTGTPEKLIFITHDSDNYSKYGALLQRELLKSIAEKNRLIQDYATKVAKLEIFSRDSKEEAKKVLKDTKDMQKVIEPEKKNPFGFGSNNGGPWRNGDD